MSKFFIDRPIFAWVIALVIMLVGALSILKLPINQYPSIAPPAISISVTYPGASAQTVQDTVVQVIEQQLNGIDHLRYVSSESNSDGSMSITATFEQGTDPDTAQVQVQNKLNLATPLLPQEVQQQGIRVTKAVKNFLMVIGVVSENGSMNKDDLSNYIVSNMQDPISRTEGVGDFQVFGAQYAMRIWLDPVKLNKYNLTPVDVKSAISAQNVQVSSGQLGGLPAVKGQELNATIIGKTRLQNAEQFKKIGVTVNIKNVDWGTWLSEVYSGRNYQSTVIGVDAASLTARAMLERFVSTSTSNFTNFSDPEYDKLYAEAAAATDEAKQVELYKQLEEILTKDAANVYIQDMCDYVAMGQGVQGYEFYPLYVMDMSKVYFTNKTAA